MTVRRYKLKDQTLCPKCGRMYCEGYWNEGVCTKDMQFCGEPTADGDEAARCLRVWYEIHREDLRERLWRKTHEGLADEFMLSLAGEVRRIEEERQRVARLRYSKMEQT